MKSQQFLITSTVGHNVIKSSWNSSIRASEGMAKDLANAAECTFTLCDSSSVKEGFYHVAGSRSWKNSKNGSVVVFSVKLLQE